MASQPPPVLPSDEFDARRRLSFALGGVVRLPSPAPATARVFLGINPASVADPSAAADATDADDASAVVPKFYLKIVETVSPQLTITRVARLSDLRAVGLLEPIPGAASELQTLINQVATAIGLPQSDLAPGIAPKRVQRYPLDDPKIAAPLAEMKALLEPPAQPAGEAAASVAGTPTPQEVLLFEEAVIYIPDTAPVLFREVFEVGTTAAAAVESQLRRGDPCQCLVPQPPINDV